MKKIQIFLTASLLVVLGAFVLAPIGTVAAAGPLDAVCANNADSAVCQNKDENSGDFVGNLVNTLLYILGAISVLVIIIGGIMYVTSGGNSGSVTKAKNTILYAIVGLIVAFLAYAIVNWVVDAF